LLSLAEMDVDVAWSFANELQLTTQKECDVEI
jgi:hypothetical protein